MRRGLFLGLGVFGVFLLGLLLGSYFQGGSIEADVVRKSEPSAADAAILDLRAESAQHHRTFEELESKLLRLEAEIKSFKGKGASEKSVQEEIDRRLALVEDTLKRHSPGGLEQGKKKDPSPKQKEKVSAGHLEQQLGRQIAFARHAVEEYGADSPVLEDLVLLFLRVKESKKATDFLKRYGELLPAWKRNRLFGRIFSFDGDMEQLRLFLQKVKDDPLAPDWAKTEASLEFALSYLGEGKKAEGKLLLKSLLFEYGDDPPVGGLEFVEKAKGKLKELDSNP